MMELALAVAIVVLAAAGLGLGLLFGRRPVQTSCSAAACLPEGRCVDCPFRRQTADGRVPE